MTDEDETVGDGKPTADTAVTSRDADTAVTSRDADTASAEEAAPDTCDHNWRLCPFYCPGCNMTFAISDEPVAWRRRVRAFQGNVEPVEPGDFDHWTLITELAAWSEGGEPPTQL